MVIPDACSSLQKIIGDQGWYDRWTLNEKDQIDIYDTWIDENCRKD